MKHKRLFILIIFILSISLISTIYLGKKKDTQLYSKDMKEYNEWLADNSAVQAVIPPEEPINFYGKLIKGMNINILVLGDEISLSQGSSNYYKTWYCLFTSWLESTYHVHATLKLFGESGATVSRGKQILDSATDLSDFDLVITCFGRNDLLETTPIADFTQNYNDLIYDLKSKNNNCIILPILSYDLEDNNIYRNSIIKVCENNDLKYVDVLDGFLNSGIPLNTLLVENSPADPGYKIYSTCIIKVISQEVTKRLILQ